MEDKKDMVAKNVVPVGTKQQNVIWENTTQVEMSALQNIYCTELYCSSVYE